MRRPLVIVRKVWCPAFAAIVQAPAHLMLAADEPDLIGTGVAEDPPDFFAAEDPPDKTKMRRGGDTIVRGVFRQRF